MYLCIDPGPIYSGWIFHNGISVLRFGKSTNKEIKLLVETGEIKPVTILIEEPDAVFSSTGFTFRDTAYEIGAFREFFKKKMTIFYGRKEMLKHFGLHGKASDASVIRYLKTKGYKLTKDAWQAALLYEYHIRE